MNTSREERYEAAAEKARTELRRIQQQSEKVLGATPMKGEAQDEDDPIERLGKKIGFGLSILLGFYVVWWFWNQFFG